MSAKRDGSTPNAWKAEARTLRGDRNTFEDELAAAIEKLNQVRELVSDPCTPGCCAHCDGKNEGWEMVLEILDAPAAPGPNTSADV